MTSATIDHGLVAAPRTPVVFVAAAIQFFFSLQATLLFPLGPVLAHDLHFSVARLGYLNAAFLVSACLTGLIGALILDSFDRRKAIVVAVAGVALSAGLVSVAQTLPQLVAIRLLSGVFGGPLIALALAAISDAVSADRRGAALGTVSRGSALALIGGVPLSLFMAEALGWRVSMALIGGLGGLFAVVALRLLPRRMNSVRSSRLAPLLHDCAAIIRRRDTAVAMLFNAINSAIILTLTANISPFLVANLGFAETGLKYVWAVGGLCALLGTTMFGAVGDRLGAGVSLGLLLAGSAAAYLLLFVAPSLAPFWPIFVLYSLMNSGRMVVTNLILSRVPSPDERGRFFSLVNAAAQAGTAAAIFVVSQALIVGPDKRFENAAMLGWAAVGAAIVTTVLGLALERAHCRASQGHTTEIATTRT